MNEFLKKYQTIIKR